MALAGLAALSVVLTNPARSDAAVSAGPLVSTTTSGLGRILVDSRGHTLYLFEKDKGGKSTCAGNCAANWPPLIASGKPRAGTGAKASLLGTTKRADRRMQVTYDKHPLYTFVKDTKGLSPLRGRLPLYRGWSDGGGDDEACVLLGGFERDR